MSTLASSTATTRASVEAALRGRKRDIGGTIFSVLMLSALLLSLLILVVLLVSVLQDAWPVLSTRGADFVRSDTSASTPAPACGRVSSARSSWWGSSP